MRLKRTACLLLFTVLIFQTRAQSVYEIRYNYHQFPDTTNYYGVFIDNGDGTGLMRVRFDNPQGETVLVELNMEESFPAAHAPKTGVQPVIYKPMRQSMIDGSSNTAFDAPSLLFVNNDRTGFIEPVGVISSRAKDTTVAAGSSFTAVLKTEQDLSRAFMLSYFREEDEVFQQFFRPRTRGLSPVEKNTRLFIRIVANINDEHIGNSCREDMKRTMASFLNIRQFLGIPVDTQTIYGNSYNKKNVEQMLNKLKPAPNDIVVFYYSGHGYRDSNDRYKYPHIDLRTSIKQNYRTESLVMEDIFDRIRKKGARLNLVMSDCCNSDVVVVNAKGRKPGNKKGSGLMLLEDNIRQLFLNPARMSILVSSTDNGQSAASNDNFGSFFTYFFSSCMETYCSVLKKNVSWDQVFAEANAQTEKKAAATYCDEPEIPANICFQHVIYRVTYGN